MLRRYRLFFTKSLICAIRAVSKNFAILKLGFIGNYGTGLIGIMEAYSEEKLQPEFKIIDRFFFGPFLNLPIT